MATGKKALVIITDGSEEMEVVTPIDVLRRANVDVSVAGLASANPVVCSRGVVIVPDGSLADLTSAGQIYDVIALPGGLKGSETFVESSDLAKLLKAQDDGRRLIAATCAASTAFISSGICTGKSLTSHPLVRDKFLEAPMYTYKEERVVVDGNLITSRAPGTALEFSLTIVSVLLGKDKAKEVGDFILYQGPALF